MSNSFYFASRAHGPTPDFDVIPEGSSVTEFYSRPVLQYQEPKNSKKTSKQNENKQNGSSEVIEQKVTFEDTGLDPPIGSLLLERKLPTKIDPKHMFAVERTFMLWMHTSLWLLTAAITIIRYSGDDPTKFMYGSLMVPVALTFTIYSLFTFRHRVYMLRAKHPGPYEDLRGPALLSIMLMISIVVQFVAKLITFNY